MPCTRLRKSLQVGQARRRKWKHQKQEGEDKESEREAFSEEVNRAKEGKKSLTVFI